MTAQGLPVGGWELEAWYQDLQEVLAAEPGGASLLWGAQQVSRAPTCCQLDAALAAELLEPGPEPVGPPRVGTEEEEEAGARRGMKRKRSSRELAKRQDRANEQRVLELSAQNQRLREEIGRLSAEVARARAQLIDRIVNLPRA
ncbi:DDIT3 protein, partial [Alcedo cyanopectus]|nr:DDIT3 protein [Ceyx cyanopectus]